MLIPALVLTISLSGSAFAGGPDFHTVTFAENDNIADSVYATQTENAPSALSTFASLNPQFSDAGATFFDWNTQPDGSGTSYSNGEAFDFGSSVVLYAIWSSAYHTVTFAENNNVAYSVSATQT
jgi:hypothetical protein